MLVRRPTCGRYSPNLHISATDDLLIHVPTHMARRPSTMSVVSVYLKKAVTSQDYVGEHSAPDPEAAAPLNDLTFNGIYPADVYTNPRQYISGEEWGTLAWGIISACHKKPSKLVTIYRAVPHKENSEELIAKYLQEKAYILKTGKLPRGAVTGLDTSRYYEYLNEQIENLKKNPQKEPDNIKKINPGDWVTIVRKYAVEHGQGNLGNKFKVLSKSVNASALWTDGDSLLEWGYNPGVYLSLKRDLESSKGKVDTHSTYVKASYGFKSKTPPEIQPLITQMVHAAQKVYDEWEQDKEGVDPELGAGGLCQDVAEAMAGVLNEHGVDASTVSSSVGDQHVWVVARAKDGVYTVDIEPRVYETGSGYVWRKRPGVVLKPQDIDVTLIDSDPAKYDEYSDDQ